MLTTAYSDDRPLHALEVDRATLLHRISFAQASIRGLRLLARQDGRDDERWIAVALDEQRSRRSMYRAQLRLVHNRIEARACDEPRSDC